MSEEGPRSATLAQMRKFTILAPFRNEEVLEEVKAVRRELEGKATLGRRDE